MTSQEFLEQFGTLAEAEGGVAKLRELVLQLAVRGTLILQEPSDETANALMQRMLEKIKQKILAKEIKKRGDFSKGNVESLPHRIPSHWEITFLGQVSMISTGYAFKSADYEKDGIFVLRVTNVDPSGSISKSDAVYFPESKITSRLQNYYLDSGDILVVMVGGSLGKIGVVTDDDLPALLNQNMWRIKPLTEELDSGWLRLNLIYINQYQLNIQKSTHGHLSMAEYRLQPIGIPPLAEQKRIVAKVDELMALCDRLEGAQQKKRQVRVQLNQASLAPLATSSSRSEVTSAWNRLCDQFQLLYNTPETLSDLRQTILQLAVQGKLVRQDPNDEPGEELIKSVQNRRDELLRSGSIVKRREIHAEDRVTMLFPEPSGWVWTHFDHIAEIKGGVTKGRKLRGRETKSYPYLRVANVQRWKLDLDVMKEIAIPVDELDKYQLQKGDLLLTEGGDWDKLGRTAIWQGQLDICLHQNHVFRARVFHDQILNEWIMLLTNSREGRSYFENSSKKTTNLASINMTQLRSCPIPIPPLAEQKRIVTKVNQLQSLLDRLESSLTHREATRTQLLTAAIHAILNSNQETA